MVVFHANVKVYSVTVTVGSVVAVGEVDGGGDIGVIGSESLLVTVSWEAAIAMAAEIKRAIATMMITAFIFWFKLFHLSMELLLWE